MDVLLELPCDLPVESLAPGIPYRLTVHRDLACLYRRPTKQGLDTEKPRLELDGHIYEGRYEELLGTALIFGKDDTASSDVAVTKTSLKLIFTAMPPSHGD